MKTTLALDPPILRRLKELQRSTGKPLGQLASELLAEALGRRSADGLVKRPSIWITQNMGARFDLDDKERLREALDLGDERPNLHT